MTLPPLPFRLPTTACLWAAIVPFLSLNAAVRMSAAEVGVGPERVLTSVDEAARAWPTVVGTGPTVRIEGVVTGTMPSGALRLHDGSRGIYVSRSADGERIQPRDRVIVTGSVREGGYSPWLLPHRIERVGVGEYPEAVRANYATLAAGVADNQWLEIEGLVRSVRALDPPDFVELEVGMVGGNLRVLVNHREGTSYTGLVDAQVRLRGVAAVSVNKHGHVVAPTFRVPSLAEIEIVRAAPDDVFEQPVVSIDRLLNASTPDAPTARVRTVGSVTRRMSGSLFFVSDGHLGLKVETARPVDYLPGDVVDLVGFPGMADGLAVLEHTLARLVRSGSPPVPGKPTMESLLEGAHNADLVSIEARLVDWSTTGPNVTLVFQNGDQFFKGLLTVRADEPPRLPERNSLVNVTGICVVSELDDVWFYKPSNFLMLVAGPEDVILLEAPPWWSTRRLMTALALVGVVLVAVVGWVGALRRQVERKRAVIEQQARHAAALEERNRIARELHDTLEQGLTGLSLQMKAMETDLKDVPPAVRERLLFARRMLRQSRALAHHAIREMRTEALPPRPDGLVAGLKRVASSWNHSGALTVDLRILGTSRPLPPRLEHHLVGIGAEAMTNAVKHGRADAILVEIDFRSSEVAVCIRDNGAGFDPERYLEPANGCFGLVGMKERAREVHADIQIRSTPGEGAEILVTAPCPAESGFVAPDWSGNERP